MGSIIEQLVANKKAQEDDRKVLTPHEFDTFAHSLNSYPGNSLEEYLIQEAVCLGSEGDFRIEIDRPNTVSLSKTQTKEHRSTDMSDFTDDPSMEIIDLTEGQKTMNARAREYMEDWAQKNGYEGAIDFWMKRATSGMDKLFINEKRAKGDHDALDKYLTQFAKVLGINSDTEKVKFIRDIRRTGDDLFSR